MAVPVGAIVEVSLSKFILSFTKKCIMKYSSKLFKWQSAAMLLIFTLMNVMVWAQDDGQTQTTTTTKSTFKVTNNTTDWYTQPWVWIVGVAVFILLLVALLKGSGNRTSGHTDKVTVTKTVRKDTDSDTV